MPTHIDPDRIAKSLSHLSEKTYYLLNMSQAGAHKEVSPQDATFDFIRSLQQQLAESNFALGINNSKDSPQTPPTSSSSSTAANSSRSQSSTSKPASMKWTDQESPGARITRLKPKPTR